MYVSKNIAHTVCIFLHITYPEAQIYNVAKDLI